MSNWKAVSDFVVFSTKGITPKYVDASSIIVLNQKCIRNGKINYSFAQFTDDTKQIQESKFVQKGDILINSTGAGTAGRCAFVSSLPENIRLIVDSHILILRCNSFYEAQCLSYSLQSFEQTLMSFMTGSSGQSELDKVVLMNLKTKTPTNSIIQRQISSLLSALDDKIELNNRINTQLEEIAKTLYDYWFVQFDFPNAAGKPYKSSVGKMVYNDVLKREVPEGWGAEKIDDLGTVVGGSTPSKAIDENFSSAGTPWITPKDLSMNIGNKFITKGELDISERGLKEASLNILDEKSVLMSSRAPVGYLAINRIPCTTNQGFKSIVCNKAYSYEYVFYVLLHYMPTIEANATGSTFKEISASVFKSINIIKPRKETVEKFIEKVKPIFQKQENVEEQNQQLTSLRDWLLPMLMNGQVTVGKAEEMIAEKLGMVAEGAAVYIKKGGRK